MKYCIPILYAVCIKLGQFISPRKMGTKMEMNTFSTAMFPEEAKT